jgi:hypothetical protein
MAGVDVNWLAVLAASVVGFAVGGLWYGPLFGQAWMRSIGMDPQVAKNSSKKGLRQIFTITFILQWIMAYCLAMFIGNMPGALEGALYGFLAGLPWVGFAIVINALYEQKSLSYMLINGSYWTVTFTLMGLIIGFWQ